MLNLELNQMGMSKYACRVRSVFVRIHHNSQFNKLLTNSVSIGFGCHENGVIMRIKMMPTTYNVYIHHHMTSKLASLYCERLILVYPNTTSGWK